MSSFKALNTVNNGSCKDFILRLGKYIIVTNLKFYYKQQQNIQETDLIN